MGKTLAMIHTVASLSERFGALALEMLPGVRVFHVVDEGLLTRILREGAITPAMCQRVVRLAANAEEDGADVILLTCSAMSPAVDMAAPLLATPIYKVDQAMVDKALDLGGRIGVFSTAAATLQSVGDLVRQTAASRGQQVEVLTELRSEAMEAARRGDQATHDERVRSGLRDLAQRCDVLVVAQASATQALQTDFLAELNRPVLTSPRLAMERIALALNDL